eukprot:NODE_425_length_7669_cov_0.863937.p4 type:complete len:403 gc:universal NODE_425_length_7669_cov_0.863937:5097-6305(+)
MYTDAGQILKKCNTKSQVRQRLYKSKSIHVRQIMPLLENVLLNRSSLQELLPIIKHIDLDQDVKLCCIYDMVYSKNRKSQFLSSFDDVKLKKQLLLCRNKLKLAATKNISRRIKPYKYARINKIVTSKDELIEDYGGTLNFDKHVPNLLIFKPDEDLANSDLVLEKCLIIQDKSSCLPAVILNPSKNDNVLDATAAPGNKTLQLFEFCENVTACEKDRNRYEFMRRRFEDYDASVRTLNIDFLDLEPIEDITHILLDPSCSGSGTLDYGVSYNDNEIFDLSILQVRLLIKALTFPSLRRFTYSTCSINYEENEQVVLAILYYAQLCNIKLRLVEIDMHEFRSTEKARQDDSLELLISTLDFIIDENILGSVVNNTPLNYCLRLCREEHNTGGFFVALFEIVQ